MVKGASRRVVVVKSPDPRYFEEAIFVLKSGLPEGGGKSADMVLKEARAAAERFVTRTGDRHIGVKKRLPAAVYAAGGAALTAAGWLFGSLMR